MFQLTHEEILWGSLFLPGCFLVLISFVEFGYCNDLNALLVFFVVGRGCLASSFWWRNVVFSKSTTSNCRVRSLHYNFKWSNSKRNLVVPSSPLLPWRRSTMISMLPYLQVTKSLSMSWLFVLMRRRSLRTACRILWINSRGHKRSSLVLRRTLWSPRRLQLRSIRRLRLFSRTLLLVMWMLPRFFLHAFMIEWPTTSHLWTYLNILWQSLCWHLL